MREGRQLLHFRYSFSASGKQAGLIFISVPEQNEPMWEVCATNEGPLQLTHDLLTSLLQDAAREPPVREAKPAGQPWRKERRESGAASERPTCSSSGSSWPRGLRWTFFQQRCHGNSRCPRSSDASAAETGPVGIRHSHHRRILPITF